MFDLPFDYETILLGRNREGTNYYYVGRRYDSREDPITKQSLCLLVGSPNRMREVPIDNIRDYGDGTFSVYYILKGRTFELYVPIRGSPDMAQSSDHQGEDREIYFL